MVTQEAVTLSKVKNMKVKKNKIKRAKKKKLKKGGEQNQDSESEGDNLDLSLKLYPLSHYVSDQDELVNQMFATIRGSKLEAMLPPVLRGIPVKELKKLCLHELRGMSKKRILCCINGQVMEGSSGSEEDEEEEKDEQAKATNEEGKTQENDSKGDKRKSDGEHIPEGFLQKKIKVEPGLEDAVGGNKGHDTGKSVLELLELEMRARIIKTMLEKGDEGKKIAEDAIAAVMQSAKQMTKDDNQMSHKKEITAAGVEPKEAVLPQPKHSLQQKNAGEEVGNEDKRVDRSGGSKDDRSSHRRRRTRDDGGRKDGRRKARDRRERSNSDDSDYVEHRKRPKGSSNSERHIQKKKKITRKEFEERMKRAKKNRTYRQRKTSEDEEKAKEKDKQENQEEANKGENNSTKEAAPDGEEDVQNKPVEEASGEVSEKEEGELDSNEEEEGACTPSDISSASNYYSSSPSSWRRSYSSRSRSRSLSRSRSRSPSRRRRRKRSYTRSRTRSRSLEWKNKNEGKRNYERISKEPARIDNIGKKGNSKVPAVNLKESKEEEENWGQKCDIEFVDSEEDFDDNLDTTKKDPMPGKKSMPAKTGHVIERASISFSLQKKSAPNIAPSIDLDDLPLKQSRKNNSVSDNFITDITLVETWKSPSRATEEIVISSDSESEKQKNMSMAASKRKKTCAPDSKQADPEQKKSLLRKEETTKSQAVVKRPAEKDHETDTGKSECLTTERQGQSMDSCEPLIKLNNEIAVGKTETKRQELQQRPDEIKADMKNRKADHTTDHTTVQEPKTDNIDKVDQVYVETVKEGSSTMEVLVIRDDTETPGNETKQLSSLVNVDSCNKQMIMDSDHNFDRLDNSQKIGNSDIEIKDKQENQVDSLSIHNCISETPAELSHSVSELINKEENHDSNSREAISEDENLMDVKYTAAASFENSKESSNDPCTSKSIGEENINEPKKPKTSKSNHKRPKANRDDQEEAVANKSAHGEGRTNDTNWEPKANEDTLGQPKSSGGDHGKPIEQEGTPKIHESCSSTSVKEKDFNKDGIHAMEKEAEMKEQQSLVTESQTEECKEKTELVKEMDNGNGESSKECLQKVDTKLVIKEKEDGKMEDTRMNSEDKEADNTAGEQASQDNYSGAEQLTSIVDEKDSDEHNVEEITRSNSPVEPIRIETGLIRKRVLRQQKVSIVMPDKSWTKRERKKKEKSRDTLVMEGIGFLKSTLSESTQISSLREDEEVTSKTNKSDERIELEETLSSSVASASETDNSLMADDNTPTSSIIHSPKVAQGQETTAPSPEAVNYEEYEPKSDDKSQKRVGQETEIIGVIETSKDSSSDNFDDSDLGGSSWSMRWLQSEKVQKVVSSSKMLSRVRKKIQKKDKATKVVTAEKVEEPQNKAVEPLVPVIGSIEEYERLFGMKVKKDKDEISDSPGTSLQGMMGQTEQTVQPTCAQESGQGQSTSAPNFGSDDEGEDSEEEALWTKILGK